MNQIYFSVVTYTILTINCYGGHYCFAGHLHCDQQPTYGVILDYFRGLSFFLVLLFVTKSSLLNKHKVISLLLFFASLANSISFFPFILLMISRLETYAKEIPRDEK